MEALEFFKETKNIIRKIIMASKIEISKMDEQEKQILGAFCFGALNGYSLENQKTAIQIQSAMIEALVRDFQYDPTAAAQFCDFLIKCTEKDYHPTMNIIIHRGLEGYYQIENEEKLSENIVEIIQKVKKYNK